MHSGGTDLRMLQELLGHAGIKPPKSIPTSRFLRLRQIVRDLHPLNHEERTTAA